MRARYNWSGGAGAAPRLREAVCDDGDSGGARKIAKKQLIEAVNHLVEHFGLRAGAGAKPHHRKWNDGTEAQAPSKLAA